MRACKDCEKREPACQDNCEAFLRNKDTERRRKGRIREAKEKEGIVVNTAVKLGEKRRRKYAK